MSSISANRRFRQKTISSSTIRSYRCAFGLDFFQGFSKDRPDVFDGCRILQGRSHVPGVIDDSQGDGRDRLEDISLAQVQKFRA